MAQGSQINERMSFLKGEFYEQLHTDLVRYVKWIYTQAKTLAETYRQLWTGYFNKKKKYQMGSGKITLALFFPRYFKSRNSILCTQKDKNLTEKYLTFVSYFMVGE